MGQEAQAGSIDCCPMVSVNPIEPGELLLHVGLHKTGTTALQVALADARSDLAAHDVRYPGSGTFQHRAILAGADRKYGWQNNGAREVPKKYWNDLVQQARFDGRTIVSSEFLDDVDPDTARRMIDELGGPQRVRVVVTLRSIGAILPSAWQQRLKAGNTSAYNQFLKMVFAEQQTPKAQRFWYRHDQVAQVQRWADLVGVDRTYAVVIPDGDRRAIFTAFEALLGLPDGLLAGRTIAIQNRSMTAQEAEFVRRLNKEVAGDLTWDEYTRTVRRGLVLSHGRAAQTRTRRGPDPDPRLGRGHCCAVRPAVRRRHRRQWGDGHRGPSRAGPPPEVRETPEAAVPGDGRRGRGCCRTRAPQHGPGRTHPVTGAADPVAPTRQVGCGACGARGAVARP